MSASNPFRKIGGKRNGIVDPIGGNKGQIERKKIEGQEHGEWLSLSEYQYHSRENQEKDSGFP